MKVGIIGLGLIGGSMAIDLKRKGFADEVLGVEADPLNAAAAEKIGLVDRSVTVDERLAESDIALGILAEFIGHIVDGGEPLHALAEDGQVVVVIHSLAADANISNLYKGTGQLVFAILNMVGLSEFTSWSRVIVYAIALVIILIKPQGIFGKKVEKKV